MNDDAELTVVPDGWSKVKLRIGPARNQVTGERAVMVGLDAVAVMLTPDEARLCAGRLVECADELDVETRRLS